MNLHSLPLFPLGTVLYPDGVLALQVFEVRYLDMIGRCHKAGAPFGVVALTEGTEVQQPQQGVAFAAVGTLARLTEWSAPQPGLQLIQCAGQQRFAIDRRERLKHGLWVADVTLLPADQQVPIPADLQAAADALRKVLASLQERGAPAAQSNEKGFEDCAWVSNRWCELLPIPPDLKQRMLELDNPLLRLELVNDILERTGIAS